MISRILDYITVIVRDNLSFRRFKTKQKIIYLTFDDGPDDGITQFILDILSKYNAHGTFFCCGNKIKTNPELFDLILRDGHSIGNHTMTHAIGRQTSLINYIKEVKSFKKLYSTILFRPPQQSISILELLVLRKSNRIILWDVDSLDWDISLGMKYDIRDLINKTKPGSIVLFHFANEFEYRTREILPRYMEQLTKLGYSFRALT
jgi:peptidoglycan/xylan/chitin deacetylase (PgdA/CDA1 family)